MATYICGLTLAYRKMTKYLKQWIGLEEAIDQLGKANSPSWCGHMRRKDKKNILKNALDLRVKRRSKR